MKKLTALLLAIAMMVTCTLCAVAKTARRTWLSASRPSLIRLTRR